MKTDPSFRSLIAVVILLVGLTAYGLGAMQAGAQIAGWAVWMQTPFYLFLGLIWIWPARALLRWAAGGRDTDEHEAEKRHD